jgi:hypothetical protein
LGDDLTVLHHEDLAELGAERQRATVLFKGIADDMFWMVLDLIDTSRQCKVHRGTGRCPEAGGRSYRAIP